jgi:sialic acid synthase SpsE
VTTAELRQLVDGCAFIGRALAHPVRKDAPSVETAALRAAFTKSVVARVDLAAGTVLRVEHLSVKKPGTGIPADALPTLLGRRLRVPVPADTLLSASHLAEDA